MISFFKNDEDLADSDEAQVAYAEWALESDHFCYARAEKDNKKVSVNISVFDQHG